MVGAILDLPDSVICPVCEPDKIITLKKGQTLCPECKWRICPWCRKSFWTRGWLLRHLQKEHCGYEQAWNVTYGRCVFKINDYYCTEDVECNVWRWRELGLLST